jgi:hypothetical protein
MMTRLERQIALSIGLFFLGLFLIWGAVFSYNRCANMYCAPFKVREWGCKWNLSNPEFPGFMPLRGDRYKACKGRSGEQPKDFRAAGRNWTAARENEVL